MSETKSSKNVKKRNWAFVLYPESAPKDWKEQLQLSGVQGEISPLHNKDVNPDGTKKKEHHHIILVYGSPTTYNNVKSLTDRLNQPIPQPLEQVRGYHRYLTHKDNPEKYQYDEKDIVTFNGFNIADFIELTKSEVLVIKRKLQKLIRENGIVEYSDFVDYVEENLEETDYDVAVNNTIFFNTYIKSKRYKAEQGAAVPKIKVDKETGEIIE